MARNASIPRPVRPLGGLAGICCVLLFSLSACRKPPREPVFREEDVHAELGLGGVQNIMRWNLLKVRATNGGGEFRGTLRVVGMTRIGRDPRLESVVYESPQEFPPGARRQVAFPVRPEAWQALRIQVRGEHFAKEFEIHPPLSDPARVRLLAIGRDVPNLNRLKQFVERNLVEGELDVGTPRCEIAVVPPDALPHLAAAYEPFQMVILFESSLATTGPGAVEPATVEALARWVEAGGTLVVFPGPEWGSGLPDRLRTLLCVDPGSGETLPPELAIELGPLAESGLYRELYPTLGADFVGGGLAVVARPGAGSVTTFAITPGGREFPGERAAPALYATLECSLARALSFAGDSGFALREIERGVASVLFAMSGFRIPPRSSVALGIGVYLLVGFFLPAFVCRMFGRREWTFVAVVLAAGLATFGIYRYGLLSALPGLELEEVSIVRLSADGQRAAVTSFLGAISPGLESISLEPSVERVVGQPLPQPLRGQLGGGTDVPIPQTTFGVDAGRLTLPDVGLRPNGMRYFRYDYQVPSEVLRGLVELSDGSGEPTLRVKGGQVQVWRGADDSRSDWPRFRRRTFDDHVSRAGVYPRQQVGLLDRFVTEACWSIVSGAQLRDVSRGLSGHRNQGNFLAGVSTRLRQLQPGYILGCTGVPVFPVGETISRRHAVTLIVCELPP